MFYFGDLSFYILVDSHVLLSSFFFSFLLFCVQELPCLKNMNLWGSQNLIEMPDLSKATNLETLCLDDCYSLVKLPSSIPHPNKLMKLYLRDCRNLESIPIGISLTSIKELYLDGCSRLRNFPQISTNILDLRVDKTSIEEIPSNLNLENLYHLRMTEPKSKKQWERVLVCMHFQTWRLLQPLFFFTI